MKITKRNGTKEDFQAEKIVKAMEKSFASSGEIISRSTLEELLALVMGRISSVREPSVEAIQDAVEESLMEKGFFRTAKAYILFRNERTILRKERTDIASVCKDDGILPVLAGIQDDFPSKNYSLGTLGARFASFVKPDMTSSEIMDALTRAAVELTRPEAPGWEFIASRILCYSFMRNLEEEEKTRGISDFYSKLRYLVDEGLYGSYILEGYAKAEIDEAAELMDESRSNLLTWSSLDLLIGRYLIRTHSHVVLESPQEMFLSIALHLALGEKNDRLGWVARFYDMLSKLEVTMATPTLANARKPYHQLSSCFIDTVPDSLNGIYRSIDNFAKVSKFGGGMGLYFGKVRANGSSIRGFEGAAGGVVRWIRLVNDTAVAVDQLGVRSGAVAVYLDAWHRDLPEFLQLRTNNGDDRMKAHDVFPAVCYPDYFWELCSRDLDERWYMMCPHEIYSVKGFHLEDFHGEEWKTKYLSCVDDARISKRSMSVKDVIRLILKSAVETGTPFAFNRDTVNRANPNGHRGMIYSSNLCTEIAQNMSAIEELSIRTETEDGDEVVVTRTRPGDLVVCNLASLSLGNLPVNDRKYMERTVETAVRALDNVIDLNFLPLEYAKITNRKYRAIGLGVSGYHHMLAKNGIRWESEEHLAFADKVFETIAFSAIGASCRLAKEKGAYSHFAGSDWDTGVFFDKRGYTGSEWDALRKEVHMNGMRNSYLLAIAPTSSTSIIAGTSAGIDPVMKRFFYEEKKGSMLPRLAPELSAATWWYYKNAHEIDQSWSVRAAGVRQRHIDQAQSLNLYITNDYTMRRILDLYLLAWKNDVKTIYYVRSRSLEVEECESCSS